MVDILQTVHFTSIENYLLVQLSNKGSFTAPESIREDHPELYWGIATKSMAKEMKEIMDSLKLLNVLSHFLYYKRDFIDVLDDSIEATLTLLVEKVEPISLSHREAYNGITVLIASIRTDIIIDRLRPLQKEEVNALTFMLQMRNVIAHSILGREQDPFLNGEIF